MRIGILFQDINKQKISWQKNHFIYDRTSKRVLEISNTLEELGHTVIIFSTLEDFINTYKQKYIDIVFPCIESCFDRNTNGFIPAILQMCSIPFIGNDSYINTIVSDKYLFEDIAHCLEIKTPKTFLIQNKKDIEKNIISFPCILKYRYGSMSFLTEKIVNFNQLADKISILLNINNGSILCEEYIEGRELSVPVIGNAPYEKILGVIEYTDSMHYPLEMYDDYWKNKNYSQIKIRKIDEDSYFAQEIIKSVHKLYEYLYYKDYARFDFRLNNNGEPFLLEGNPLPAISPTSAFNPLLYGKKITFKDVLSQIVESAALRYNL